MTGHDPELTLTVLRLVAVQRWKPVISDERAVATETTLAISWSGPGFGRRFRPPFRPGPGFGPGFFLCVGLFLRAVSDPSPWLGAR